MGVESGQARADFVALISLQALGYHFCDTFFAPRCAIFFRRRLSLCLFIFLTRFRFVLSKRTAPPLPTTPDDPTPHPLPAKGDESEGGRPTTTDKDDGGHKAAADEGRIDAAGAVADARPAGQEGEG